MDKKEIPNISLEEIEQHCEPEDAWMAIRGYVFDVTSFIKIHPGGAIILEGIG